MIGVAAALSLSLALAGQHCGGYGYNYGSGYASYAPAYSYGYNAVAVPYVEKLKFVAVEHYPYDYQAQLVGPGIRAQQREQERKQEQESLLTILKEIKAELRDRPTTTVVQQTPPEIQTFAAPRLQYAPSPQQQAAPQPQAAPQYAPPPLSVPEKAPAAMPPLQPVQPPGKGVPGYAPAPLPPQTPRPDPNASGSWGPMGKAEANQVIMSVLTNNCANCHGGGNEAGGLAITDSNGNPAEDLAQNMSVINAAVLTGRMPKGSPLPPVQRQAFGQAVLTLYPEAILALYQQTRR